MWHSLSPHLGPSPPSSRMYARPRHRSLLPPMLWPWTQWKPRPSSQLPPHHLPGWERALLPLIPTSLYSLIQYSLPATWSRLSPTGSSMDTTVSSRRFEPSMPAAAMTVRPLCPRLTQYRDLGAGTQHPLHRIIPVLPCPTAGTAWSAPALQSQKPGPTLAHSLLTLQLDVVSAALVQCPSPALSHNHGHHPALHRWLGDGCWPSTVAL